jgi:TRAP-type C4-dicarboxylate transport system permease small subunit
MIERLLATIENLLMLVACVAACLVVGITTADVVFRYGLTSPLNWAHDVITQYLLIAMFFLSLPYVMRVGGHMRLDYLARRVGSPVLRNALVLLGDVVALLVVVGIAYGGWSTMLSSYAGNDSLPDIVPLPTWPSYAMVALGSAILALRLVVRIAEDIVAMRRGEVVGHVVESGH